MFKHKRSRINRDVNNDSMAAIVNWQLATGQVQHGLSQEYWHQEVVTLVTQVAATTLMVFDNHDRHGIGACHESS